MFPSIFPSCPSHRGETRLEVGLIVSAVATRVPLGILAEWIGKWPVIPIASFGKINEEEL